MSNTVPDPGRTPTRNARDRWIGLAFVALIAIAVGSFLKSRGARPPVPDLSKIQSIEADFYNPDRKEKVTFQVPPAHWQSIVSALVPANRDSDPAKWVSLGELQIKLAGGDSFLVSMYNVSDGPGAFSSGPNWDQRVYYRGGSSANLEQALAKAFEASEKVQ